MFLAGEMGCTMDGLPILDIAVFTPGTFAAAFVTGLAGFAFGILPALALGTGAGLKAFGHLNEADFRRMVPGLLLLSGISLVFRGV